MSNLPSIRLVSWNTELGVGVMFTSMPVRSKKPFSCATQIGQLKPPGKTIRFTVLRDGGEDAGSEPFGDTGARCPDGPPAQDAIQATVFSGGFLSFWSARNSGMSGREPHMQNDSGAKGNCRGR